MSNEQRGAEGRIELEPVTCWPLIYGAAGFVCLGLLAVGGLALSSALRPRPEPAAQRDPTAPTPREARAALAVVVPEQSFVPLTPERQVVVKREVVGDYTPLPPLSAPLARPAFPRPAASERRSQPQLSVKLSTPEALSSFLLEETLHGEQTLRAILWKESKEIDLEKEKGTGEKLAAEGAKNLRARQAAKDGSEKTAPPLTKAIRDLLAKRDDLRGLPLADEKDCQSNAERAQWLRSVSTRVRTAQARRDRSARSRPGSHSEQYPGDEYLVDFFQTIRKSQAKERVIVGPVTQMFEVETPKLREELVATLAAIPGSDASQALARRAVFDLSPQVRKAAVKALAKRPAEESRPVLLAGLRHVWPQAAFHAASALIELNDQKAVAPVKALEELPDPSEPFQQDKKWYARELVRVNHLRNCLLCHSPSTDRKDPVLGPVPTPGKPLPEVYYGHIRGGGERAAVVRADVVYFRQDFSAMHPVADAKSWPEMQRFDYLVRTVELTAKEAEEQLGKRGGDRTKGTYPQREAVREVLSALRSEKGVAK